MSQQEKHRYGAFESVKFAHRRDAYYRYLDRLKQAKIPTEDLLEHFTAYVGHMSLNRALTLYELYKKTQHLAGHIAEVGVYRGAGSLLFAKLVKIFESESLTQVHGFDWFKGTGRGGGGTMPGTWCRRAGIVRITRSWWSWLRRRVTAIFSSYTILMLSPN